MKLDSWTYDMVDIMKNVGNKLSNDFWEYRIPINYNKPQSNASLNDAENFIKDKYIKKMFVPSNFKDPASEYLENKNEKFIIIFLKKKTLIFQNLLNNLLNLEILNF